MYACGVWVLWFCSYFASTGTLVLLFSIYLASSFCPLQTQVLLTSFLFPLLPLLFPPSCSPCHLLPPSILLSSLPLVLSVLHLLSYCRLSTLHSWSHQMMHTAVQTSNMLCSEADTWWWYGRWCVSLRFLFIFCRLIWNLLSLCISINVLCIPPF